LKNKAEECYSWISSTGWAQRVTSIKHENTRADTGLIALIAAPGLKLWLVMSVRLVATRLKKEARFGSGYYCTLAHC